MDTGICEGLGLSLEACGSLSFSVARAEAAPPRSRGCSIARAVSVMVGPSLASSIPDFPENIAWPWRWEAGY